VSGEGGVRYILDNTAVSNFSAVGRMDILRERYGGQLVVTPEVLTEAEGGPEPNAIRRATEDGWIEVWQLYADSEQYALLVELRERGFGLGEASALAACSSGGPWVFVSDDLDARNEAGRRGIGVVGTYGVLARHVAECRLSLKEGNRILREMIDKGFRSHSNDLSTEVERLKSKR
jgi:predicted nucleic acid-binding protein